MFNMCFRRISMVLILVFLLHTLPAIAETGGMKLTAEVTGTQFLSTWNGNSSDLYDWLAVDVRLTNWHVDRQTIADLLFGHLTYREVYAFDAVLDFPEETIDPLVEMEGALVFQIPKMVSRVLDEDDVVLSITIEGEERAIDMNVNADTIPEVGSLEGPGFETPEEAVLAYLDAMNCGDAQRMLSTFAFESVVEYADPETSLRRTGSFQSGSYLYDPFFSDYAKGIILASRYGELANTLRWQYIELSLHNSGMPISGFTKDITIYHDLINSFVYSPVNQWKDNVQFIEWVDPTVLSGDVFLSPQNVINIARQSAVYGTEDYCILAAHIRLNGKDAIQTMGCGRYEGRWYNINLSNNLSILMNNSEFLAGMILDDSDLDIDVSKALRADVSVEHAALIDNWKTSGLIGTHWQLVSLNRDDISVADSSENIRDTSDRVVWASLRFMHHGGAMAKLLFSPALDSLIPDGDYENNYTLFTWMNDRGKLEILESGGIRNPIDLEGVSCIWDPDAMTFEWPNGMKATFRQVAG